ncbi:hypothetical protein NMG60_11015552 [Bertholletia excelsa]
MLGGTKEGCGCGKPKLSDVVEPKPRPKPKPKPNPTPMPNTTISYKPQNDEDEYEHHTTTTTPFSFDNNVETDETNSPLDHSESKIVLSPSPKLCDSIAMVKHSHQPYLDFRHSMVQMITERQIYSTDDLQQLLNCFLLLNSPTHHHVILQAFMDICNGNGNENCSSPSPKFQISQKMMVDHHEE